RRHPPRAARSGGARRPLDGDHRGAGHRLVRARARPQQAHAARLGRPRRGGLRRPLQGAIREAAPGDLRMSPLLSVAIAFALGCYVIASVLVLVRLVRGPRAQDRVLALDLLYFHAMLVMLVLGIRYQNDTCFE